MHTHTHTRAHTPTLKCQQMCCIKINPNAVRAARRGQASPGEDTQALAVSTALPGLQVLRKRQQTQMLEASRIPQPVQPQLGYLRAGCLPGCGAGLPAAPEPQPGSADGGHPVF